MLGKKLVDSSNKDMIRHLNPRSQIKTFIKIKIENSIC